MQHGRQSLGKYPLPPFSSLGAGGPDNRQAANVQPENKRAVKVMEVALHSALPVLLTYVL